jgi:hypothetical protein
MDELRTLEVAWPETPEFRLDFAPRRRARWPLAVAVALAALAAAFAVPQSRGAILRFLDLGGVTIELVGRLPAAQERPLGADLGPVVTPAVAAAQLGRPLLLPDLHPLPPLHLAEARVVSLVFTYRGEPVLLSEFAFGGGQVILKKVAGAATRIEPVPHGLWLEGGAHVFLFPGAPPRLTGNVLLVERGEITLRIEGKDLKKSDALRLAAGIR